MFEFHPGLLAQMPVFLCLIARDGTLLWSNQLTFGLAAEILGQPSDLLVFDEDKDRYWDWFRRALYHRETNEYSVRIKVPAKPGFVRLHGRMGPVVLDGQVAYVATVTWDATFRDARNPLAPFILTPLSRQVVALLLASGPMKGAALGRRLGRQQGGQAAPRLRAVLAGLVERGVLVNASEGYAVSEPFRHLAAELLAGGD